MHMHGYSYQKTVKNKTKNILQSVSLVFTTQLFGGVLEGVYVYWRIRALSPNAAQGKGSQQVTKHFRKKKDSKKVFYESDLKKKKKMVQPRKRSSGWFIKSE